MDYRLKIGDKVRLTKGIVHDCSVARKNPNYLIITNVSESGTLSYSGYDSNENFLDSCRECLKENNFELIDKQQTIMSNIINTIKLARMNEPEKTLIKANLMELNGELTSEGKEALNDLLVQEYKEKLKTQYALPIIEEKEKNK